MLSHIGPTQTMVHKATCQFDFNPANSLRHIRKLFNLESLQVRFSIDRLAQGEISTIPTRPDDKDVGGTPNEIVLNLDLSAARKGLLHRNIMTLYLLYLCGNPQLKKIETKLKFKL